MMLGGDVDMGNRLFGARFGPSKMAARRENDPDDVSPDSFSPTDAVPGSQEKLRVLVERIESGLPLWHPADRVDTPPAAVEEDDAEHLATPTGLPVPLQNASHDPSHAAMHATLPIVDNATPRTPASDAVAADSAEIWRDPQRLFDFERIFGVRK